MRLALISDVHGNLLALEAVLAELERDQVDRIVCLGDVAAGPQASQALERIRALDCPVIMGNWDAWSVDGMPEPTEALEEKLYELGAWWAERLSEADREFIRTFTPMLEVPFESGGALLCFHGSPRSYDDWLLATTPDDEVERMLGDSRAPLLAGGHTHLQLLRRYRDSVIVNPGSVGLPFHVRSREEIKIGRRAEYAVVSVEDGKASFDLRRTSFDVDAHLRLSRESGMPHADWWVSTWKPAS